MGDVFAGRYELVDPLGEGGAGVVWRVWDRRDARYLAAKVLRQVDAASLLRFIREQSVRIEHPHVLTPIGWAGEDDRVLFTMPIVRGGSVATLVGDFGALPATWAATLLDQLLAALERIHAQRLVHRDVKPANLLLDATGREHPHLRLSDFGVAAAVDEPRLTHGSVALGTPGYLAPECMTQGWDLDPLADLFAAGMSAVEMLIGARPDPGMDVADVLAAAGTPAPLATLVIELTDRDPARRLATATVALERLRSTGLVVSSGRRLAESDIEVFDQIPELPPGWGATGPAVSGAWGAQASPPTDPARRQPHDIPRQPDPTPRQPHDIPRQPDPTPRQPDPVSQRPRPAVPSGRAPERAPATPPASPDVVTVAPPVTRTRAIDVSNGTDREKGPEQHLTPPARGRRGLVVPLVLTLCGLALLLLAIVFALG